MSPALAGGDSDVPPVELMFESLMKLHSDGDGGSRWEAGLAAGPPQDAAIRPTIPIGGRRPVVQRRAITARDVRDTVRLFKKGKIPERPPVWGDLLDEVDVACFAREPELGARLARSFGAD